MSSRLLPSYSVRLRRKVLFPLLFAGILLLGAVVLSEIASRTMRHFVCVNDFAGQIHLPNAGYGWGHLKNADVERHACLGRSFEYKVRVRTNSKGLCDDEHDYGRAVGVPRILVLGDSVAEAAHVERGKGFADLLEKRFDALEDVDVVNTGVAGFSLQNQVLYYRNEGVRYSPDLVLSEFNIQNDVAELYPAIHRRERGVINLLPAADVWVDDDGELGIDLSAYRAGVVQWLETEGEATGLRFWARKNLYAYRAVSRLWSQLFPLSNEHAGAPDAPSPSSQAHNVASDSKGSSELSDADLWMSRSTVGMYAVPAPPDWERSWELVEAAYRTLRREAVASGAKLQVFIVPAKESISAQRWEAFVQHTAGAPSAGYEWDQDAPRRRIAQILTKLEIPFLDLTQAMRAEAQRTGNLGFFDWDPHPNAKGHAVIAEALRWDITAVRPDNWFAGGRFRPICETH